MSFGTYDERRVWMIRQGFHVRFVEVSRETGKVTRVGYVYEPSDDEEEQKKNDRRGDRVPHGQ